MRWSTPCRWCRLRGPRAAGSFPDGRAGRAHATCGRAKDRCAWDAARGAAPGWRRWARRREAWSSSRLAAFLLLVNVRTKDRIDAALVTVTFVFEIVEYVRIDAHRDCRLPGRHDADRLRPGDITRA